jgi:Fe2+ transport system protein FeoA
MTLEEVALNRAVKVEEIQGLGEKDIACLLGMGIRLGVSVTKVIATPLKDPVECLVGSQLLAVEKRLFKHIHVKEVSRSA